MRTLIYLRHFTLLMFCLAAAACGGSADTASVEPPLQAEVPPNIIWIISDDQAYSDFGFMGHDLVKTPNLDKLAAESALFPNGYVPTSLCRASLATLITGKYAFDHGICFNDAPDGVPYEATFRFLEAELPIPQALKAAGYRSMQTGKFWEGVYTNGGFTDGMTEGRRAGGKGLRIGRKTMEPIDKFLTDTGDDPFFLWFAPYLPHAPFNAIEDYKTPFQGRGLGKRTVGYYANISWLDDTVGELMALLEKNGKTENTIIMFVVDNGWLPNRDGESFRDLQDRVLRFDPRSKSSPYEGGVRTPIFIRWPEKIPPGKYDNLVSSPDFFPTTLAMAGLAQKDGLPGVNLLPFAQQKMSLAERTVFGEIYYHTSVNLDDPDLNVTHKWARKGDWKLIVNVFDDDKVELYNLVADPKELQNLAAVPEQQRRIQSLMAEIDAWWPAE